MSRIKTPVDFPKLKDLDGLYECENADDGGDHNIEMWEIVTNVHYDVSSCGSVSHVDQEWEVLWFNCECGHQTYR